MTEDVGVGQPFDVLKRALRDLARARGYFYRPEAFQLSSGGLSHDYVDMRRAVARGRDLALAARAVLAALDAHDVEFDALGGLTMGADPVAHAVALLGDKGWFSVRKAEKEHGRANRVEGTELGPGVRAVLFEDTTTTGRSVLEALEVVAATGARVVAACTLLDRGDQARALFAARRVAYYPLLTYEDLGIDPIGAPRTGSPAEDGAAS